MMGYQDRDFEVVDYQEYTLPRSDLRLRGPAHEDLPPGGYIACLGGAQTYGCFCSRPYPSLLQAALGLPVLNLGYAGAGPEFFLRQPRLMELANNAAMVILQVMSGRSVSNHLFDSEGLEYLRNRQTGEQLGARRAYQKLIRESWLTGRRGLKKLVEDTRANWVGSYHDLRSLLEPPTVLLYFSHRGPHYKERYFHVKYLFGGFPHLVNKSMVDEVAASVDKYVQCVSHRGSPQPLYSRFDGRPVRVQPGLNREDFTARPWTHNSYYPSPEMHEDAATSLMPLCRELIPRPRDASYNVGEPS